MNLPPVLDRKILAAHAAPDETHAIRIILLQVASTSLYRLRGRKRQYLFERDDRLGAHSLEIPLSVWMDGQPTGVYRDNPSLSHDLQPVAAAPFVLQVVPWTRQGRFSETSGREEPAKPQPPASEKPAAALQSSRKNASTGDAPPARKKPAVKAAKSPASP